MRTGGPSADSTLTESVFRVPHDAALLKSRRRGVREHEDSGPREDWGHTPEVSVAGHRGPVRLIEGRRASDAGWSDHLLVPVHRGKEGVLRNVVP